MLFKVIDETYEYIYIYINKLLVFKNNMSGIYLPCASFDVFHKSLLYYIVCFPLILNIFNCIDYYAVILIFYNSNNSTLYSLI